MNETRSLVSEYDYQSKRKFTDIMKPRNRHFRLKSMQLDEFNRQNDFKDPERMSVVSKRSGVSMKYGAGNQNKTLDAINVETIQEEE